ncbi:hypothetical protein RA267_30500, partial [Pseudomonas syringae pv. tagetis]|uniref:hypothetical protein n=1 Tax=Pseudomonas syringae group genomosp. 7 TaxID=251699 RepID=UPI00376F6CF6
GHSIPFVVKWIILTAKSAASTGTITADSGDYHPQQMACEGWRSLKRDVFYKDLFFLNENLTSMDTLLGKSTIYALT